VNGDTLGAIDTPVINIPGCPPHPDWIVGTIATLVANLDLTDLGATLASVDASVNYNRPRQYYGQYQCNAGPCPWRFNNTTQRKSAVNPDGSAASTNNTTMVTEADYNPRYPQGDSKRLGTEKWQSDALGCLGILGCKGRKTRADCSLRRWNSDPDNVCATGVNWCVGSRAGCHGCTEPTFPDKVGKFFTFA